MKRLKDCENRLGDTVNSAAGKLIIANRRIEYAYSKAGLTMKRKTEGNGRENEAFAVLVAVLVVVVRGEARVVIGREDAAAAFDKGDSSNLGNPKEKRVTGGNT
jgi:hypothetical protein